MTLKTKLSSWSRMSGHPCSERDQAMKQCRRRNTRKLPTSNSATVCRRVLGSWTTAFCIGRTRLGGRLSTTMAFGFDLVYLYGLSLDTHAKRPAVVRVLAMCSATCCSRFFSSATSKFSLMTAMKSWMRMTDPAASTPRNDRVTESQVRTIPEQ